MSYAIMHFQSLHPDTDAEALAERDLRDDLRRAARDPDEARAFLAAHSERWAVVWRVKTREGYRAGAEEAAVVAEGLWSGSQNVDRPWPAATPTRSSDVGDLMVVTGRVFMVAPCGMLELGDVGDVFPGPTGFCARCAKEQRTLGGRCEACGGGVALAN